MNNAGLLTLKFEQL